MDYLSRQARYHEMAAELHFFYKSLGVKSVLDFGCGVGFFVSGLQALGYECAGFDISEWAINYGKTVLKTPCLTTDAAVLSRPYDLVVALDVFEHMKKEWLPGLLSSFQTRYLMVRMPVCESDGQDYVLEISRNDPTHLTCLSKKTWHNLFRSSGYRRLCLLNKNTIWDSTGVYSAVYAKKAD